MLGKSKHQRFNYKPRYYDERKERMKERLKKIESEKGDSAEAMKTRIAAGLKSGYMADESYRKKQLTKSNLRLLYIFVFLGLLAYLVLSVYLPKLMQALDITF